MSRHIVALIMTMFLCTASASSAQDADRTMSVPIAQRLLDSADPKEQAWGAWMAGRLLMTDAMPGIERVIRQGLAVDGPWSIRAIIGLDALIEIGAKPGVPLLAAARATYPVQVLLLAKLDPAANSVLLATMADSTGYPWFAAANLLYARKGSGFAALLLKDLELTAVVVVSDDGSKAMEAIGGGSGGVGDRVGGLNEGYPPTTDYQFRSCRSPNTSLLAAGSHQVCYEKARSSQGHSATLSSHYTGGPSLEERLSYFERDWYPVKIYPVESRSVAWSSDADTKFALTQLVGSIRVRYAAALAKLREGGWLTEDEVLALARPTIHERVVDLRP